MSLSFLNETGGEIEASSLPSPIIIKIGLPTNLQGSSGLSCTYFDSTAEETVYYDEYETINVTALDLTDDEKEVLYPEYKAEYYKNKVLIVKKLTRKNKTIKIGDFSTSGCVSQGIENGMLLCACTHLSDFAVQTDLTLEASGSNCIPIPYYIYTHSRDGWYKKMGFPLCISLVGLYILCCIGGIFMDMYITKNFESVKKVIKQQEVTSQQLDITAAIENQSQSDVPGVVNRESISGVPHYHQEGSVIIGESQDKPPTLGDVSSVEDASSVYNEESQPDQPAAPPQNVSSQIENARDSIELYNNNSAERKPEGTPEPAFSIVQHSLADTPPQQPMPPAKKGKKKRRYIRRRRKVRLQLAPKEIFRKIEQRCWLYKLLRFNIIANVILIYNSIFTRAHRISIQFFTGLCTSFSAV